MLNEAPAEEDLALARIVMDSKSPEQIASALIRLHRSRLPEPEELFDTGPAPDRREPRGPKEPREPRPRHGADQAGAVGASWFRLAIGRSNNADPKWLIPLICRMGHVTKKDIGQIRIFDRETKFEILSEAEARFLAAIAAAPKDKMRIEPAGAPGRKPEGPPHRDGPARPAHHGKVKPRKPKG